MPGLAATPGGSLARGLAARGPDGRGSAVEDRASCGWIVILVGAVLHWA